MIYCFLNRVFLHALFLYDIYVKSVLKALRSLYCMLLYISTLNKTVDFNFDNAILANLQGC